MPSSTHEPYAWLGRLPSLEALRFFEAVARARSFSEAARRLHVTQGAVSHRIRGLEEALGVTLFSRAGRRVELTEEGLTLLRATEEALSALDRGLETLLGEQHHGHLMVSCSPSFAIRWLVPNLAELRQREPGIDVRISADDRLVEPGRAGIDVCIRYGPGGSRTSAEQRLCEVRVLAVCSPSLISGARPLRAPADLAHHTLLHDEVLQEHPDRVGWAQWLAAAGAPQVEAESGPRFSHAYMALEAALAGQGVALARGILVSRDLRAGRLVAPFPFALKTRLGYQVLSPLRARANPIHSSFVDWLVEAVQRDGDELDAWGGP